MCASIASGSLLTLAPCSGTSASTQVGEQAQRGPGTGQRTGRGHVSADTTSYPVCRREAVPVRDVRQGLHTGQLPHRPRAPAHWGEALRLRALRQEVLPWRSHPCPGVPILCPVKGAGEQIGA